MATFFALVISCAVFTLTKLLFPDMNMWVYLMGCAAGIAVTLTYEAGDR